MDVLLSYLMYYFFKKKLQKYFFYKINPRLIENLQTPHLEE